MTEYEVTELANNVALITPKDTEWKTGCCGCEACPCPCDCDSHIGGECNCMEYCPSKEENKK